MMNFCPKCGSKLVEGTAFCTNCGTSLSRPDPGPKRTGAEQASAWSAPGGTATVPRSSLGVDADGGNGVPKSVAPFAWIILGVTILAALGAAYRPGLLTFLYRTQWYDTVLLWAVSVALVVSAVKLLELSGALPGVEVPQPWPTSPQLAVFMPLILVAGSLVYSNIAGWWSGSRNLFGVITDVAMIWEWWDFWRYEIRWLLQVPAWWILFVCAVVIAVIGSRRQSAPRGSFTTGEPHAVAPVGAAAPTTYATTPGQLPPTNSFAIVSLVLSVFGISLLAVIFGHISLGQIKRTGGRGRGMALAGTIIGWIGIVVGVGLVIALVSAAGSIGY